LDVSTLGRTSGEAVAKWWCAKQWLMITPRQNLRLRVKLYEGFRRGPTGSDNHRPPGAHGDAGRDPDAPNTAARCRAAVPVCLGVAAALCFAGLCFAARTPRISFGRRPFRAGRLGHAAWQCAAASLAEM